MRGGGGARLDRGRIAHSKTMGFLDIIEMVIDWNAASLTYGNSTLRSSLEVHRKRFHFTHAQWWLIEQVVEWLEAKGMA